MMFESVKQLAQYSTTSRRQAESVVVTIAERVADDEIRVLPAERAVVRQYHPSLCDEARRVYKVQRPTERVVRFHPYRRLGGTSLCPFHAAGRTGT